MASLYISFVFFFFQAEDGIRDIGVTGVQTCALFFSSRRRHTRYWRDWSSDVCSSDLRDATSAVGDWAKPHSAEAMVKPVIPIMYIRRRPYKSPRRPPVIRRTANDSA